MIFLEIFQITIIQNIYSNDCSFKTMFVSYIYMEIQKNLSSAADRRSSFLIEKLEDFLDLYQITDEVCSVFNFTTFNLILFF